jgi:predicted nucleic acid-binding protein
MTKVYISDTNIWIDFRNANLLAELFQLPLTLCSTDFVMDELADLPQNELVEQGLRVETLNEDAVAQLFTLMGAHRNSSLADVSCYYLAQQTGHPLLTGDGKLRKQATKDGIQVFGVLWLLDQLVAHSLVTPSRAAAALRAMLEHGARLPPSECHSRLLQWQ